MEARQRILLFTKVLSDVHRSLLIPSMLGHLHIYLFKCIVYAGTARTGTLSLYEWYLHFSLSVLSSVFLTVG